MPKEYELYLTIADAIPVVEYFAKAVKIFDGIVNFGKESAEEQAIRLLREHIAVMQADIRSINRRVDELNRRVTQSENLARIRQLGEHAIDVESLALRLDRGPDADELADIANRAGLRASAILDDRDLWLWSDLGQSRAPNGEVVLELVEPDFKVLPLPVLAGAVSVFVLAAAKHIAAEPGARAGYAERFGRFHSAVRVRPRWVDTEPPETLPEQIRWRIVVSPHAVTTYVTGGQCVYGLVAVNRIERSTVRLRDVAIPAPAGTSPTTLCTAPSNLGEVDEAEIEDSYEPLRILAALEDLLDRMRTRGTLRDPYVGRFDTWTMHALSLYAVEPDGRLIRFECRVSTELESEVEWTSSRATLGIGWHGFERVLQGDWNVLYAVKGDGEVLWYRHDGAEEDVFSWTGPHRVAGGPPLGVQERHIAGTDGYLYRSVVSALSGGGGPLGHLRVVRELTVDRHPGVASGTGSFVGQKTVHPDWPRYAAEFGGSQGVVYGIDDQGRLFWHRHVEGGGSGDRVEGPVLVGTGWDVFAQTFSAGYGFMFGIYPNGRMLAYRLENWQGPSAAAPARWKGPVGVRGSGWTGFAHLVPTLQGPRPIVR